jgi:hypothetical protein
MRYLKHFNFHQEHGNKTNSYSRGSPLKFFQGTGNLDWHLLGFHSVPEVQVPSVETIGLYRI